MNPVSSAVIPSPPYPANSLRPIASPRCRASTRSFFIATVIDHVKPWLAPNRTFATRIHVHDGPHASMNGTGRPISHPLTSIALRVNRSASMPDATFDSALTRPNATMNEKMSVSDVR